MVGLKNMGKICALNGYSSALSLLWACVQSLIGRLRSHKWAAGLKKEKNLQPVLRSPTRTLSSRFKTWLSWGLMSLFVLHVPGCSVWFLRGYWVHREIKSTRPRSPPCRNGEHRHVSHTFRQKIRSLGARATAQIWLQGGLWWCWGQSLLCGFRIGSSPPRPGPPRWEERMAGLSIIPFWTACFPSIKSTRPLCVCVWVCAICAPSCLVNPLKSCCQGWNLWGRKGDRTGAQCAEEEAAEGTRRRDKYITGQAAGVPFGPFK